MPTNQYVPNGNDRLISSSGGLHLAQQVARPAGSESVTPEGYAQLLQQQDFFNHGDAALYVHLPFCASRCLSCDNNTTVTHDTTAVDRYLEHLGREMDLATERAGRARPLAQLHLGGGTPNYLTEPQLIRLMGIIETYFVISESTSMSLDASPRRSSYSQLALLRGLGFRDIRFDVRDLDPTVQMALGRSDSLYMLQDVFANARESGLENISMDLVYGLPHQTMNSIARSLDQIKALGPDRVSCRTFSRKPEAFSHQRAIDSGSLPSLADRLVMFNSIVDRMQDDGYTWVGLDYFAKSDDRLAIAQDKHELYRNWIGYNLHGSPNLLGFGTSAISETFSGIYAQNHPHIPDWQASVERDELPIRDGVQFSASEQQHRRAISGLLCNMELGDYAQHLGLEEHDSDLRHFEQDGLIEVVNGKALVTPEGRYTLHHMLGTVGYESPWTKIW
jgi:oxygen-independent coproporphyrinogen-3 oxidase